jgi:hypothetical protein
MGESLLIGTARMLDGETRVMTAMEVMGMKDLEQVSGQGMEE